MRKAIALPLLVVVMAGSGLAVAATRASPGSTPPPTPVPPLGSPSPFPTVLATPKPSQDPPELSAASAILEDLDTGQVLYTLHPDDRRPIASTTKIMTALVVLQTTDPSDVVTVSEEAAELGRHNVGISELGVQEDEKLTVRQLLFALLLQSANDSAVALADHVSGSTKRFVALMNRKAKRFGFSRTTFYSPNGLDDRGYSTARSLAAMTRRAEDEPQFARIARTKFHVVPAPPDGEPRHIQNRNVLLWLYPGTIGVKTGFTTKAGHCLVAAANLNGTHLLSVVLGEPSSTDSFSDAASLFDYGFHAFVRREVAEPGRPFEPLRFGDLEYPVAAASALSAWVPADAVEDPDIDTHLNEIDAPPTVGERVGSVTLSLDGRVLGRVPLLVAGAPEPAPGPRPIHAASTPWWRRGIDTVNEFADGLFHAVFG